MNTDLIFDALDYIDDDMLEDVDALRAKKKVNPNRIWMRYASVAACLCVIIGAVYLLDRTGMIDTSEVADEMAQDNMSGEEKVHNYVRADIITYDRTVLAVNDPQKITAIYDILRTELQRKPQRMTSFTVSMINHPVGKKQTDPLLWRMPAESSHSRNTALRS